jgi:amidase
MSSEITRTTSAREVARAVRARHVSAVEVVTQALATVEQVNGPINAVVTLNPRALDEARRIDARLAAGDDVGVLAGVPVGIKDLTPVAGLRTTYGSSIYADHVPTDDAVVVTRLREAGAVVLGKTNTPEFGAGASTWNDVFGRTRNPWNLALSAGGSTGGGAAALASGMIGLADGTDLGGSLRLPAAFCGVVGLRPSPGLVPQHPCDWVWDTLSVSGPMARTVEDVALMLRVLAGSSPSAPLGQATGGRNFEAAALGGVPAGLRVAYCADLAGIGMDASIASTCTHAARSLVSADLFVEELALDLSEFRDAFITLRAEWFVASMFDKLDHLDRFGVNARGNTEAGLAIDGRTLGAAHHARGRLWQRMRDVFSRVDCVLTPTVAVPPFPVEQNYPDHVAGRKMRTYVDWFAPTFLLSLTGLPVASVPCGLDERGLPVGIQVVGRPNDEETVLALAAEIQRRHPVALPV